MILRPDVWILMIKSSKKANTCTSICQEISPTSFSKDVDSEVISVCVSISGVELDIIWSAKSKIKNNIIVILFFSHHSAAMNNFNGKKVRIKSRAFIRLCIRLSQTHLAEIKIHVGTLKNIHCWDRYSHCSILAWELHYDSIDLLR